MGNTWIIDVLADLRSFAIQNDLPNLADQLDEAMVVAREEVGVEEERAPFPVRGDAFENGILSGGAGAGRRA